MIPFVGSATTARHLRRKEGKARNCSCQRLSKAITVFSIISQHSCNCSSVITSGGAKRIMLPCVGLANKPLSFKDMHKSQAVELSGLSLITMAIEQPFTSHHLNKRCFCDELIHPFPEKVAQFKGVFRQSFVFYHFQGCDSNLTSQGIAAKSAAVLAGLNNLHHMIICQYRRYGIHPA